MPISQHEEKMVNLQYQMRENQADLQNFLTDLDSWETDIKEKDQKLTSSKSPEIQGNGAIPPVRNTIHKKKLKKKRKEKTIDPAKPKTISGFDFKSWDKFDVDKALEEIDQEDEKDTSSSEYETDEEWELERKKHLAETEKEKGNKFFKAGEYDLAVEAYTQGINYDATSAVLPANRAMALLKQQKYAAAEIDCTTSISLDPMYVKAYLRRANARVGLKKVDDAIADYNRVLDLEPSNKMAKAEIENLNKEKERNQSDPPPSSTLTEGNQGIVKPIYKPTEERSKVALRRIPIEEIGIEKPKRIQAPNNQSECSKKIKELESRKFDSLLSASKDKAPALTLAEESLSNSHGRSRQAKHVPVEVEVEPVNDVGRLSSPMTISNCDTQNAQSKSDSASSPGTMVSKSKKESSRLLDVEKDHSETTGRDFNVPQSSFQFQTDYKLLRTKSEEFFKYFIRIPSDEYPKLFGQFLDADILNRTLKALLDFSDSTDSCYKILLGLTAVKRFSMTAMFLSQKEKQVARDLIKKISDSGVCLEADLLNLKKKYDL